MYKNSIIISLILKVFNFFIESYRNSILCCIFSRIYKFINAIAMDSFFVRIFRKKKREDIPMKSSILSLFENMYVYLAKFIRRIVDKHRDTSEILKIVKNANVFKNFYLKVFNLIIGILVAYGTLKFILEDHSYFYIMCFVSIIAIYFLMNNNNFDEYLKNSGFFKIIKSIANIFILE